MENRKKHKHKNLNIWIIGTEIMKYFYDLNANFQKREDYKLTSQIINCAMLMPSNIDEGLSRTDKGFSTFLDYNLGSSFELGTQLITPQNAKYITEK
ncbi:MAG: four helix bundle protein [Flavobacteriaceae bacterium]|nr:four helix bundle protein [Flavobacteriaceae bacterium]